MTDLWPLAVLQWCFVIGAIVAYLGRGRVETVALWVTVVTFGADELVRHWAWFVVGVLGGAMTRESSPGRAW
jgi:hypothetical protein